MNRYKYTRRVSIIGILGNIFLLVIKLIIGLISNSQAMIADAINSAGDIFSSFMSLIGNKIASKPEDNDHNLGHGKAEYIFSLIISISMILASIILLKNSILSFKSNEYNYSIWLIIISITTIITKFSLYLYAHHVYKIHKNILIEASAKDHRNDCFVTLGTLISIICYKLGITYMDGIVGIIISLWILYTGIKLFIESYDVLIDSSLDEETKNKIIEIIKSHKEVLDIQHFNSTPVGYKYMVSVSIFVDGNLSTFESHEIADSIEKEIKKKIKKVHLTIIHVNAK